MVLAKAASWQFDSTCCTAPRWNEAKSSQYMILYVPYFKLYRLASNVIYCINIEFAFLPALSCPVQTCSLCFRPSILLCVSVSPTRGNVLHPKWHQRHVRRALSTEVHWRWCGILVGVLAGCSLECLGCLLWRIMEGGAGEECVS